MSQSSGRGRYFIKTSALIALSKGATQFLTLLALPLYTRLLDESGFGLADFMLTVVAVLVPLCTLQLEMGVFRFLIDARGSAEGTRRVISSAVAALSLLCLTVGGPLVVVAWFLAGTSGLLTLGCAASIAISGLLLQVCRGQGRNTLFAVGSVVTGILIIAVNFGCLVLFELGGVSLVVGAAVGNLLGAVGLAIALRIWQDIHRSDVDPALRREILGYSAPLVPNALAWWGITALDRIIVTFFLGLAPNGVFAVASKFGQMLVAGLTPVTLAWSELAALNVRASDSRELTSRAFGLGMRLFAGAGACLLVFVHVGFDVLVGDRFEAARPLLPLIIGGAVLNSLSGILGGVYVAHKDSRGILATSLVAALCGLLFSILAIHWIGLWAPALASLMSNFLLCVLRCQHLRKHGGLKLDWRDPLAAAVPWVVVVVVIGPLANDVSSLVAVALGLLATTFSNWYAIGYLRSRVVVLADTRKRKGGPPHD